MDAESIDTAAAPPSRASRRERWVDNWVQRRHGTQAGAVRLANRRLYIIPSGHGYAFALMLFVMLLWAINYSNSMGFVLTFLLAAVALHSMWRCQRNLLDLKVSPGRSEPVFAGQNAYFAFDLEHPDRQPRYGIGLQWRNSEPVYADIAARDRATLILPLPAKQRGMLRAQRLKIVTRFPLGLFQAWSWINFDSECMVYPRPEGVLDLPQIADEAARSGDTVEVGPGSDDYSGLRNYSAGDSPRRIAWKASARNGSLQTLLVKRFSDNAMPELWLDWTLLDRLDTEARLSQLCHWLLDAHAQGRDYGLRLPGLEIRPAHDDAHRHRCLQALALFETAPIRNVESKTEKT